MKRMHVHVSVQDLPQSIGFYSALFDAEPAVVKPDYAAVYVDVVFGHLAMALSKKS